MFKFSVSFNLKLNLLNGRSSLQTRHIFRLHHAVNTSKKTPQKFCCFSWLVTVDGVPVSSYEAEGDEEQAETEVQITAAVIDLTGDSDMDDAEAHEDDYSSFELDDSDEVIGL